MEKNKVNVLCSLPKQYNFIGGYQMKRNTKPFLSLLFVMLLCITVFAGCGSTSPTPSNSAVSSLSTEPSTSPSTEPSTSPSAVPSTSPSEKNIPETATILECRYVVPGSEPKDSKLVDEEITKQLQLQGVPLNFSRIYVPWDVWQQKTNIMLQNGDPFEMIHIMEDWIPSLTYVSRGGLVPVTDYLDQYGPNLKEAISQQVWDATKINGKSYVIPVMYRDFSAMGKISIQKQYFDKYNLPIPSTPEELISDIKTILAGENNPDLRNWIKMNPTSSVTLQRLSDKWPFTVLNSMIMVDQQGNVSSWLESNEFKTDANFENELYKIGYTPPDILSVPSETVSGHSNGGDWIFTDSTAQFSAVQIKKVKPDANIVDIQFAPEKPNFFGQWVYMNGNALSVTSPNPEAGVMFFNWLYKNQENYDLLNYGIKDKHWTDLGNREYDPIYSTEDPTVQDYSFGDWEIGNYKLVRAPKGTLEGLKTIMFGFDPDAKSSIITGFSFDSEPVKAEYAACLAELESSIYPIKYGVVAYDKGIEKAVAAMNAAGYEKVIAEYAKQFSDWLKTR